MNETELALAVRALPERFTDRLPERTLRQVTSAARAGEWGEAVDNLLASLHVHRQAVTPGERDELRQLLQAMGLPTEQADQLDVTS